MTPGSTPPDMLIRARGLHTYYGASHILRGIDFDIPRGQTIGLMGRNGMGKSTLLKSLVGLVKPRSGTVEIMGRDMTARCPPRLRRGRRYDAGRPGRGAVRGSTGRGPRSGS